MDEAEGDGVGTNTERTPLLGDGFGKTNNRRFCSSIVGLSNISVKTRGRRYINDGAILLVALVLQKHYRQPRKTRKRHTLMRI